MLFSAVSIVAVSSFFGAGAESPTAVKDYVTAQVTPFLAQLEPLKVELNAANVTRAEWSGFTEDWKSWTPEQAAANTSSYNYGEYLWSARKDKAFRTLHTDTPAAKALKAFQTASGGKIAEFFVTDARGGNVCQTALTSDWFQGDEAKFTEVEKKTDAYYAEPKRDDTVGETGVQVSIPLYDGKKFIGVAVVLVIVEKL